MPNRHRMYRVEYLRATGRTVTCMGAHRRTRVYSDVRHEVVVKLRDALVAARDPGFRFKDIGINWMADEYDPYI